jgi:hypothetical protein
MLDLSSQTQQIPGALFMRRAMFLCGYLLLTSFPLPARDLGARGDELPGRLGEIHKKYEEWQYPNAEGGSKGGHAGESPLRYLEAHARLKTKDDFLRVVTFYTTKIVEPLRKAADEQDALRKEQRGRFTLRERLDLWVEATVSEGFAVSGFVVTRVNASHGDPVSIRILTRNSPGKSVSVVITRAKDEEWTHIDWVCYETD